MEAVDYFKCKDIDSKNLYPAQATGCSLRNIQSDGDWTHESIDLFRVQKKKFHLPILSFSISYDFFFHYDLVSSF